MELEKEDHNIKTFMGTTYTIGTHEMEFPPKNIGELRSLLKRIAADFPDDGELEISEVNAHNGKLDYTLVKGIVQ